MAAVLLSELMMRQPDAIEHEMGYSVEPLKVARVKDEHCSIAVPPGNADRHLASQISHVSLRSPI